MNILSQFFSKAGKADSATPVAKQTKLAIPEDSMLKRHFLTHLRSVIEAEIVPNSVDSSLNHYYEAAVAAEFQKRLIGSGF